MRYTKFSTYCNSLQLRYLLQHFIFCNLCCSAIVRDKVQNHNKQLDKTAYISNTGLHVELQCSEM
jgi:hypothetical protein